MEHKLYISKINSEYIFILDEHRDQYRVLIYNYLSESIGYNWYTKKMVSKYSECSEYRLFFRSVFNSVFKSSVDLYLRDF